MTDVQMISGSIGSEYNWGIKNYILNLSKNIGKGFCITVKETESGFLRRIRPPHLADAGSDIIHLSSQTFGHLSKSAALKPVVITCHDMMAFSRPDLFERRRHAFFSRFAIKGMERCDKIVCVSEFAKKEAMHYMGIDGDDTSVIHSGISENFRPRKKKNEDEYIVYFGSEERRKNVLSLIDAFAMLKKSFPELKLVKNYDNPKIRDRIRSLGLEKDVIITGNLTEDAMAEYYSNARVFVYPSLFEGFGFTPLEAMACGCPAASSNAAPMPEILGDAPMYFDPCDPSAIYGKGSRILSDKDLSGKMSRKSLKRAKEFTWKAAAKKTRKVYEEVLQ